MKDSIKSNKENGAYLKSIIDTAINNIKIIDDKLKFYEDNLRFIEKKLSKKSKLQNQIEITIEKDNNKYTKEQLKELRENNKLLLAEVALINKKEKKIKAQAYNLFQEKEKLEKERLKALMEYKSYGNQEKVNTQLIDKIFENYNTIYIIDTNIFIDKPDILNHIDNNELIVISKTVVDELDGTKLRKDIAYNVREAIRNISNYNKNNMIFVQADKKMLPYDYKINGDNLILSVAIKYKRFNPMIVTNDIAFRLKAKAEGIKTITLNELYIR